MLATPDFSHVTDRLAQAEKSQILILLSFLEYLLFSITSEWNNTKRLYKLITHYFSPLQSRNYEFHLHHSLSPFTSSSPDLDDRQSNCNGRSWRDRWSCSLRANKYRDERYQERRSRCNTDHYVTKSALLFHRHEIMARIWIGEEYG